MKDRMEQFSCVDLRSPLPWNAQQDYLSALSHTTATIQNCLLVPTALHMKRHLLEKIDGGFTNGAADIFQADPPRILTPRFKRVHRRHPITARLKNLRGEITDWA